MPKGWISPGATPPRRPGRARVDVAGAASERVAAMGLVLARPNAARLAPARQSRAARGACRAKTAKGRVFPSSCGLGGASGSGAEAFWRLQPTTRSEYGREGILGSAGRARKDISRARRVSERPGADPSRGRQQRMSGMCYA